MSSATPGRSSRQSQNESVQVVVRCRPMNDMEETADCSPVVQVFPTRGVIEVENPKASGRERKKMFTYDGVYDWNANQQCLYDETVRPLVSSVLDGYNGCVFAYGQTGTGKTYTMEGIESVEEQKGLVPRAFDQIWSHINRTTGIEFLVCVRYLEIYMEEIRDLLKSRHPKPLELREMEGQGVFVTNLHSQTCQSAADMLKAMRIGNKNRTTGATNMNMHSSRSHAIFQISIEMAEPHSNSVKVGKLNLIDLAGSERQSKTGATEQRLKEASKINKALSSLGNVIYALAENSPHIPYRDSKLTRLLQDSLGGNSKTIMIANIGPASMNYEETVTTLRYSYRAKSIKNQPIKNEDIKDAKLLDLQNEIDRLKKMIAERNSKLPPSVSSTVVNGSLAEPEDVAADDEDDDEEESSDDDVVDGENDVDDVEKQSQKREREQQLELEKMEVDELNKKLKTLEKQLVQGGKNILDSVNENEQRLEQQRMEIAARKKREIEMHQRMDLEEESLTDMKEVFANLQQEVEFKREKLKRLHAKLQSIRQEIKDSQDEHIRDRQEIAEANEDAALQLRQKLLVLENFVPNEERTRMLNFAQFDENSDNWMLKTEKSAALVADRPVAHNYRRPISDYAIVRASHGARYRAENVIDLKLDAALRTTQDYQRPPVCPQVKAAVKNMIRQDTENNRLAIKAPPTGFQLRSIPRSELEGRYNKASRNVIQVPNSRTKEIPKSAKTKYIANKA